MTLGEQFKQIRLSQGLSQPELAELAGIEQSYLSKLENDKSQPSNDILRKLLQAYQITLATLLAPLEQAYIKENLLAIADIEQYYKKLSASVVNKQRNLLYLASVLIVVAVTMFYSGFSKVLFSEEVHEYYSRGVVLEGEPLDVFTGWFTLIDEQDRNKFDELRRQKGIEIAKRKDPQVVLSFDNKGQSYDVKVDGGRRLFKFKAIGDQPRSINAWLQIFGVFFMATGIMCFVLERRFYKN